MTITVSLHGLHKVDDNRANSPSFVQMEMKDRNLNEVTVYLDYDKAVMVRDFLSRRITENWPNGDPHDDAFIDDAFIDAVRDFLSRRITENWPNGDPHDDAFIDDAFIDDAPMSDDDLMPF